MTTNVYDGTALRMATDSRWTMEVPFGRIYVDDTGFDKLLVVSDRVAATFAGDGRAIAAWKTFLLAGTGSPPSAEHIACCIWNLKTGVVDFKLKQSSVVVNDSKNQKQKLGLFAGSGATPAINCWVKNFCANTAVLSAAQVDFYTGGLVRSADLASGKHDTSGEGYSAIDDAIIVRGFVMYAQNEPKFSVLNQTPVPIKDAEKTDPRVAEVIQTIKNGTTTACAPFPDMYRPLTAEEQEAVNDFAKKYTQHR